jgi:DNA replication factor GINS
LDEFFQRLREIQKKERSLSGLSPVGDDFYQRVFRYLDGLMEKIGNNQLSLDSYLLLRDAQRIVAEICERREHKITNSAVMNVQRSYQLFIEQKDEIKPQSPLNSTPEEVDLYNELFRSLSKHRKAMNFPINSSSVKSKKKKDRGTGLDNATESNHKVSKLSRSSEKLSTGLTAEFDDNSLFPPIEDEIYHHFGREPVRNAGKAAKSVESIKSGDKVKIREIRAKNSKTPRRSSSTESSDKAKLPPKAPTEVLMITAELPSIMGVDHKVYGPMYPGDVITMPEANARILIKKDKGRPIQRYK